MSRAEQSGSERGAVCCTATKEIFRSVHRRRPNLGMELASRVPGSLYSVCEFTLHSRCPPPIPSTATRVVLTPKEGHHGTPQARRAWSESVVPSPSESS